MPKYKSRRKDALTPESTTMPDIQWAFNKHLFLQWEFNKYLFILMDKWINKLMHE